MSPEALDLLRQYGWPGNVRELQSVLKQALLQGAGPILLPEFLPAFLRKESDVAAAPSSESPTAARAIDDFPALEQFIEEQLRAGADNLYESTLRRMEQLLLTRVLQQTSGNQLRAAKVLGITRGSLRSKIRDLGITIARTVTRGEEDRG